MASAADRFASVAKLLSDMRVNELLKENRELKMELFWHKYNYHELRVAMTDANLKFMGPDCKCSECSLARRRDDEEDDDASSACRFVPYFNGLLAECGLTSQTVPVLFPDGVERPCGGGGHMVLDVDTHLVGIGSSDWGYFTYGSKLWKACSVDDPELRKLVMLFEKLQEELGGEGDIID